MGERSVKTTADAQRFQSGAQQYAAYLETAEGRLRADLTFANLQEFLPHPSHTLHVLDTGCGTGAMAMRLAQLGCRVTLFDSSTQMLELARRAVKEAGTADRVSLKQGDACRLADLFPVASFDIILCHSLLEYLENPGVVLGAAAGLLRNSSSILSILVRNQTGEVLKAAIKDGDLAAAKKNLSAEWTHESLYGGNVRLFTSGKLQAMIVEASLELTGERGVRVLSDYLPAKISRDKDYERIFDLECKLGKRHEFVAVARYAHCFARRASPS